MKPATSTTWQSCVDKWLDPDLEDSCGHQQRSRKDSWLRSCQVCRERAFRTMRDWLWLPPWAMMSWSYLLASGITSFSTYLWWKIVAAPPSRDTTAETAVCPAALHQRPSYCKVVAVRARCDDHVKPKPSSFLDVAHVSPVLDVLNGLVLGHYPMTAVWLGIRPRFKIVESSRTVPLCVSCPSVHRRQQWQVRPVLRSAGWIIKRNVGRLRVANSPR